MIELTGENLSLSLPIYDGFSRSLKAQLDMKSGRARDFRLVHALKNLNFSFKDGDRIGLIGHNGAGKSTLLRILAGVHTPTSGRLIRRGVISSFLSIGVGMDNDASGYENIPLLMAALRIPLSRKNEITAEVEKFSELGEALFRPVRTYSSGMRLRLAFAVSTSKKSDILLIDEVVGVGDENFQIKSQKRLEELMHHAGILVVASHSEHILTNYCQTGIILDNGEIKFNGDIHQALDIHYSRS